MSSTSNNAAQRLFVKGNYASTYREIPTENPGHAWREGMVSGNGENGYITAGSPYSDTFIFQNIWFIFPSSEPRTIPQELTGQLDEARENVFNLNENWKIKDASGNRRKRTFYYCYHPAHQLRLNVLEKGNPIHYKRWTNFESAETGVCYTDEKGDWQRTSFTSRADNVTITKMLSSSQDAKLNLVISIDDISSMHGVPNGLIDVQAMQYKKLVDADCHYIAQVAHYPSYEGSELTRGGYAGVTRVVAVNGRTERILLEDSEESMNVGAEPNPAIRVIDADAIYLITKSDRTFAMGELADFRAMTAYEICDQLQQQIEEVVGRYSNAQGEFDYNAALSTHATKHGALFNAVEFRLGEQDASSQAHYAAPAPEAIENSEIINMQRQAANYIVPAFMKKVYDQGRYAMICCSGTSAPRLYGMWTGEWNSGWRSIYTLDANVNLQVAAMNTGRIHDAALGYITFFLRNAPDFAENAKMAYGMHDALQVSVNSDGDRAMHVEYDNDYPFQYWNAGASWCLLPIYEYWQCYGNQQIPINSNMRMENLQCILGVEDGGLSDEAFNKLLNKGQLDLQEEILLPLLTKQANFWEQICTPEYYTDAEGNACYKKGKHRLEPGEKYMILPAYSPENHPIGYHSIITANATMDIAAARDGLHMVIAIEKAVKRKGYEMAVEKWETLLTQLPNYVYDEDGALREWAMKEYVENNNHRHLSHLYPAWPAYETNDDTGLHEAARLALKNRNLYNTADDTAGHGWMHKALVAARLKDGEEVVQSLLPMMINQGYYTSLMTDHDTNRRCYSYCTDTLFGTVAVVNEAMIYSNSAEIELLPALPQQWKNGSIKGLMTRAHVEVTELSWDIEKGKVAASLCVHSPQRELKLSLGLAWSKAKVIVGKEKTIYDYKTDKVSLDVAAGTEIVVVYII
ncbi:glycosyl hydrolase family 95 catalytic domain-containing protein [Paenibacillus sp. FSL W7-1287]|uniref:glycosyl hydrolase family 95 catalytic domain-containing protein n=1 Tax=Paenibacillus sp. FSL W7-1287 TaxID=2954538 RepID=UPI0030FA51CA